MPSPPCISLGQVNVNPLLKSPPDGGVQDPGNVGGAEHQDPVVIVADALHLDEELRLDPPRRLGLVVRPLPGQAVHLVDEDDAGFVLPRHLEQVLDELLRLSQPLGHKVRAGHREEC